MENNYEPPQSTDHLDLPIAECNHIKHCNDCKVIVYGNMIACVLCFLMMMYEMSIINQVLKYEQKYGVKVYEREFKWEHLKGPHIK